MIKRFFFEFAESGKREEEFLFEVKVKKLEF
jgi:hypothetical protein